MRKLKQREVPYLKQLSWNSHAENVVPGSVLSFYYSMPVRAVWDARKTTDRKTQLKAVWQWTGMECHHPCISSSLSRCMYVWQRSVWAFKCYRVHMGIRGQLLGVYSLLSLWILGIELGSSDSCGKYFCPLSHWIGLVIFKMRWLTQELWSCSVLNSIYEFSHLSHHKIK